MDINQQESAGISLSNLLRQYSSLTQALPLAIFRADLQGNCIYVNETGYMMLGSNCQRALGSSWTECIHWQDRERVLKDWAQAVQTKSHFRCEYRYQGDDGQIIWVVANAVPEMDEQQEVIGYIGSLTDITERKQVEEQRQKIYDEVQGKIKTTPDLFLYSDREGKILDCRSKNPAWFSTTTGEWVGKSLEKVLPSPAGTMLFKAIEESLRIRDLICLEYKLKIGKSEHYFAARIVPFKHERAIAIVRDITAEKTRELELIESAETWRTLIDISTSGLVVLDPQGKVLFVNPEAEIIFGRRAIELVGQVLGIPISTGQFMEIEICHSNGTLVFVRMKVEEIVWHEKPAYLASMMDITARKEFEEKLNILERAIEQSPVSIVITDPKGNIEYVNPRFEQLTGYTQAEVGGKNPRILNSGKNSPQLYKQLWQTITAGQEWHGEFINRKKNGELFWEAASISPIKNERGKITHFVAVKEDITERKAQEQALFYQANYDALTGLPNRCLAMDRLRQSLNKAERNQQRVGILFVDLDHFKKVNDTLGHEYGDLLLKQVAQRLTHLLRRSDTVARLGGDEFLIIIAELKSPSQCKQIASKILVALAQPFDLGGEQVFISGSIGITCFPDDGKDVSILMRNADLAMYQSKRAGRNDFKFSTASLNEAAQQRVRLENLLHSALRKGELHAVYQPLVQLHSNQVVGAEALMRWHNPELGPINPDIFIAVAEESGLINDLGHWILSEATQQAAVWHKINLDLWVAVNLSPRQFREIGFIDLLNQAIADSGIMPHNLELEITEKLLLEDVPSVKELIHKLHEQGFGLSIDDFGTGYSSLCYLIKFPFNAIKIDRSFISNVPNSVEFVRLVKSLIAMAHSLNLKVIAEGIETKAQVDFLKAQGCDYGQGYFFSQPLHSADFQTYLQQF